MASRAKPAQSSAEDESGLLLVQIERSKGRRRTSEASPQLCHARAELVPLPDHLRQLHPEADGRGESNAQRDEACY